MQALKTFGLFIEPLERSRIPYFITGSTASIFYGEPRLTLDIDVVIHLASGEVEKFISLFPEVQFYCPPADVIRIECARQTHGHFNLIHPESGFKADIYPISNDPLHTWAFNHRRRTNLGAGTQIWLAPPEYIIIRKLEYFREGESAKHLEDIRKMLPLVGPELDRVFLEDQLVKRGLIDYWNRLQFKL